MPQRVLSPLRKEKNLSPPWTIPEYTPDPQFQPKFFYPPTLPPQATSGSL